MMCSQQSLQFLVYIHRLKSFIRTARSHSDTVSLSFHGKAFQFEHEFNVNQLTVCSRVAYEEQNKGQKTKKALPFKATVAFLFDLQHNVAHHFLLLSAVNCCI